MADRRRGGGDQPDAPYRPRRPAERRPDRLWIYGIHTVAAALGNPARVVLRLVATDNARGRLVKLGLQPGVAMEPATPRELGRLLGPDAVHQGIAALVAPLSAPDLDDVARTAHLILVLDQVTDPHNVGAVLRSAAAMGADAVVTTARHAPADTAVLAKAASGALDHLPMVAVPNLARALESLGERGFLRIGLDSEAAETLESALSGERIALVLGAEGQGLRRLTRETCDRIARLDLPGPIKSLNVSNAAAVALYLARGRLGGEA